MTTRTPEEIATNMRMALAHATPPTAHGYGLVTMRDADVREAADTLTTMAKENADLRAELAALRETMGRLAAHEPIYETSTGDVDCCYCHERWRGAHEPDCPWLKAFGLANPDRPAGPTPTTESES